MELQPEADLMIRLMQQNAKDAAFTTNALLENYKNRAEELEEEIRLIRLSIKELYADGWQPTESAVMRALYPSMHS